VFAADGDELENLIVSQRTKLAEAKIAATRKIGYRGYDDEFDGSGQKPLLAKYEEQADRKVCFLFRVELCAVLMLLFPANQTAVLGPSADDAAARRLQAVRDRLRAKQTAAAAASAPTVDNLETGTTPSRSPFSFSVLRTYMDV
jgi:hypothetical protein